MLITDHKALCYLFNMRDCGSRHFRQKLELMDYNFKILYRPGAQNHVADALSRVEPLSIEEIIEIDKAEECYVLTRAQTTKEKTEKVDKLIIEEKSGTILRKGNFDIIFHLIPIESDDLKNRIMDKYGIIKFNNTFNKIQNGQYYRLISNQFANKQNNGETIKCINEILEICKREHGKNIAINLDYENLRHYMYFKQIFEEIFRPYDRNVLFYLNKILYLKERDDINQILNLYHKSILGGHIGVEKMIKTIGSFYKWENMTNDVKKFVKECTVCEKTKVTTNNKVPMQISSLENFYSTTLTSILWVRFNRV